MAIQEATLFDSTPDGPPMYFQQMAGLERLIGHSILRWRSGPKKGQPLYLDELPRGIGRFEEDAPSDCGPLCQVALDQVGLGQRRVTK